MKIIDIVAVVFLVFMAMIGRRTGFVKSVLGTVSVLVCGILTVLLYKYFADAGIVSVIEEFVFSHMNGETVAKLKLFGVVDYIASGICVIAFFIVVRIGYRFLAGILDFVVPDFLNKPLGGLFGFLKGVAVLLCILAVIYYVSGSVPEVVDKIDETTVVSVCYYNNPVVRFFR